MNDCIVIIPTYNEIENIESNQVGAFNTKPFHILIVDDNSPDRTADRVRLLQTEFSGRLFWKIEKEAGLGTAYVHGFKWALENKYDFILKWMLIFS
jgi:dolichol-phosphate mannosyltransferase